MDGSVDRVTSAAAGGGGLKTCPRCGAKLFEDMDVCYGCLYDFNRDAASRLASVDKSLAELVSGLDEPDEAQPADARPAPVERRASPTVAAAEAKASSLAAVLAERDGDDQGEVESLEPVAVLSAPMRLRVRGAGLEMNVTIPARGLLVGRAPSCDVVVDCPAVSARHLMLEMREGAMVARDLGAKNPALVNGWGLAGACTLRCGDVVEIRGAKVTLLPMPEPEGSA